MKEARSVVEQKQVNVKEITSKVVMHALFATTEGCNCLYNTQVVDASARVASTIFWKLVPPTPTPRPIASVPLTLRQGRPRIIH